MKLQIELRPYRRRFRQPLRTAHGLWSERRGFLLRLTGEEGQHGYGEAAPAPWLGSETLEEAEAFLRSLAAGDRLDPGALGRIGELPACRFAIDSAMIDLRSATADLPVRPLELAALLPAGREALAVAREKFAAGYRAFKWKIGVEAPSLEREIFGEMIAASPPEARYRLDANGGLSPEEAREWLKLSDETGVELLEQPLPAEQYEEMAALELEFATPLALDESIGNGRQFQKAHRRGWRGLYVVKPAMFGAMREAVALFPPLRPRLIFSSAFETSIGFESVLRWASRWQADGVAAGLGTGALLEDDGLFLHPQGPKVIRGLVNLEKVWSAAGSGS